MISAPESSIAAGGVMMTSRAFRPSSSTRSTLFYRLSLCAIDAPDRSTFLAQPKSPSHPLADYRHHEARNIRLVVT